MQEYPKLKTGQVALIRAEIKTGIILDKDFRRPTSVEQNIYTIYDDVKNAILDAQKIVIERGDVECSIFDINNNLIKRLVPIKYSKP